MTTNEITEFIDSYLKSQQKTGKHYITLTAGEVGKMVNMKNRTPMMVNALCKAAEHYNSRRIHDVPSGFSTTIEYEFYL